MDMQFMKMQILEVGLLILGAYIGGLVARKLHIGEIVGQILGGMVVGPSFWEWIHRLFFTGTFFAEHPVFNFIRDFYEGGGFQRYSQIFESYNYFTFLFLGVIAFSLGEELHHERLRRVGIRATFICVFQGLMTFAFISFGFKLLFGSIFTWIDAFIIGSIGIATAPAITFTLMNKFKIEGPLKNILANIVVLDDIMEVIIFSIFLAIAQVQLAGGENLTALGVAGKIFRELGLAVMVAFVIFFVLKFAFKRRKLNPDNDFVPESVGEDKTFLSTILFNHPTPSVEVLLIIMGVVAVGIAWAIHLEAPFLITAVIAGYLISNFHHSAFFDSLKIDNVMTILNLLFYGIIGVSININHFNSSTLIFSLVFFILRLVGKLFGNWSGAILTKQDPKIIATLPKLMLPQIGIAAVEIVLVAAVLKDGDGMLIFNTILPAMVAFDICGAYITGKTLERWKDYTTGEREAFDSAGPATGEILDFNELLGKRVYGFNLQNKEGVLHKLTEYAAVQEIIDDVSAVYQAILDREKLGHVSNDSGIALPHIRLPYLQKPVILCGVLKTPIRWNPEDEYLVHTVFLLLTPEGKHNLHIKTLQAISLFCRQPDYIFTLQSIVDAKHKQNETPANNTTDIVTD